jgi:GlpG protein
MLVLLVAAILYIWSVVQGRNMIPPSLPGIIPGPVFPAVARVLLYDYPHYFELRDQLLKLYTKKDIEQKKSPSAAALALYEEIKKTPVWMGAYDLILNSARNKAPLAPQGPLFEKISQGEVWRLVTPALLHLGFLHIFFNALWFILLSNQIEYRIGWWRSLLLMILVAIISNTAQYLMSGPFFLGLSGIVTGQAGFIWARQQKAPWEGYLLNRFTLIFLGVFVLAMFFLSLLFFFLQLLGKTTQPFIIANTAHLTGALVGYILGRMRFFAVKHQLKI